MFTEGLTVTEESSEVTASPQACPLYFSRQDTSNAENYIPKGHHQFCKSLQPAKTIWPENSHKKNPLKSFPKGIMLNKKVKIYSLLCIQLRLTNQCHSFGGLQEPWQTGGNVEKGFSNSSQQCLNMHSFFRLKCKVIIDRNQKVTLEPSPNPHRTTFLQLGKLLQ